MISRLSRVFSPEFLSTDSQQALAQWYSAVPQRPVVLKSVLRADVATSISDLLSRVSGYEESFTLLDAAVANSEIKEVSRDEFFRASPHLRFENHDIHRSMDAVLSHPRDQDVTAWNNLRALVAVAITGTDLRDFIASAVGTKLDSATTFEFARYRNGQWLGAHADSVSNRRLAMNIYLDRDYSVENGAVLGYRDADGEVTQYAPEFNTASLFATIPSDRHWVTEYVGERPGRYVMALGFHE